MIWACGGMYVDFYPRGCAFHGYLSSLRDTFWVHLLPANASEWTATSNTHNLWSEVTLFEGAYAMNIALRD